MTRILLVLAVLSLSLGAGCSTIRDATVYTSEIQFVDMSVRREAPAVRRLLTTSCTCSEAVVWTSTVEGVSTEECEAAADWYRTYVGRWAWHISMMRYNGSVISTDPGAAPEIVTTCELPEAPVEVTSGGAS